MAVFEIYKYFFKQTTEETLFVKGTSDKLIDKAQELFDEMLQGDRPFPLKKENRDHTISPLDNEVLAKSDRVALMLVCNEKHKKYQDKKDDKDLEYFPGCYVVFDNREGIANLAIERTPAFENNPDKVSLLLQKAINDAFYLKEIQLKIEIRCKVKEASLWDIVDHQVNYYNDRISKVVFNFPIPGKIAGIDAPSEMKDKLEIMASIASAINGAKGSYHVEAERGKSLHLQRTQEDLAQMVHLCSRNVYDIYVYFQYYGLYRFGADEKALSSLDDRFIKNFKDRQIVMLPPGESGFELMDWLDKVRYITEDFKDAVPLAKKRKKRN